MCKNDHLLPCFFVLPSEPYRIIDEGVPRPRLHHTDDLVITAVLVGLLLATLRLIMEPQCFPQKGDSIITDTGGHPGTRSITMKNRLNALLFSAASLFESEIFTFHSRNRYRKETARKRKNRNFQALAHTYISLQSFRSMRRGRNLLSDFSDSQRASCLHLATRELLHSRAIISPFASPFAMRESLVINHRAAGLSPLQSYYHPVTRRYSFGAIPSKTKRGRIIVRLGEKTQRALIVATDYSLMGRKKTRKVNHVFLEFTNLATFAVVAHPSFIDKDVY